MKSILSFTGRTLQLIGLLILPSAIWVAEFQKSETGSIAILLGGIGAFFVGWVFTRLG